MKLYEAMFVIDSSRAERDFDGACAAIDTIIKRHGGNVVDTRRWDDRRLAYEIGRTRRGTYVLVHFEAPTLAMEAMRRDFTLAEEIVRQLITIDIDGVPTGDERPGITSSAVADLSERDGFGRGPRRGPRSSSKDETGDEDDDEADDDDSADDEGDESEENDKEE